MRIHSGLCLALALFGSLAACGGSGGSGTPAVLTLTSVAPTQGSSAGGTAVTLQGTAFASGATVTFAGTAATAVNVVDSGTLTCLTPAGAVGPADVAVTVGGSTATLTSAYTYYPPPTLTSVTPPMTSNFGGTLITIVGTGFTANAAGTNTVTIGGVSAASVVTVDDTTLTCVTLAGTAGLHPVAVTNANGTATTPFSLFEPILVAEGGGNPIPPTWDLWALDVGSAFVHHVGSIGFGVTSMDFAPDGTLYGGTAPGGAGGPRQLIQINPVTGGGTLVGNLDDAVPVNHTLPGCSFVGATLYGTDGPGLNLISVNTATGLVSLVGPNPVSAAGGGFASDVTSTSTYYVTGDAVLLHTVNVTTGVFTPGPLLNGFTMPFSRLSGAAFHHGVLYALDVDGTVAGQPTPRQIVRINTATGLVTAVGPILPIPFANAIASRVR